MTSTEKKVLVVFGATGAQGGSVANSILSDPKTNSIYHVRAITRDPTKPAAKALVEQGAEAVSADLNDKSSLLEALKGAHSVFAVTNFWESASADTEIKQGKNVADAAKEAGVQHLIWSSLLNTTELTRGKLSQIHHFDSKAKVEEYIREIEVPATFFLPGFYMSNVPNKMMAPNPQFEGAYVLALPVPPHAPFPMFDTEDDTGKFVKGILLNRDSLLGKRIYGATEYVTAEGIVEQFKEVKPEAGKTAKFVEIPHEAFKQFAGAKMGLTPELQEEMLQNLRLMDEGGYFGEADLEESKAVAVGKLTTWKEYIVKTMPDVQ